MQIGKNSISADLKKVELSDDDKKIIEALNKTSKSVSKDIENYEFGNATHTLYDFFWHDFCDQYIEKAKARTDEDVKKVLMHVLLNSLRLFHPFIPFITEEIYQSMPLKDKEKAIIIETWPN
jgi:valyl-tRNA synthetase